MNIYRCKRYIDGYIIYCQKTDQYHSIWIDWIRPWAFWSCSALIQSIP